MRTGGLALVIAARLEAEGGGECAGGGSGPEAAKCCAKDGIGEGGGGGGGQERGAAGRGRDGRVRYGAWACERQRARGEGHD